MNSLSEDVWCTIVLFLDIFDVSAAALASPNFLITNRVRRVAINCQTERKIVASRARCDNPIVLHTVRSPTSWLTRVILANNLSFTVWGGMRSGTVNDAPSAYNLFVRLQTMARNARVRRGRLLGHCAFEHGSLYKKRVKIMG